MDNAFIKYRHIHIQNSYPKGPKGQRVIKKPKRTLWSGTCIFVKKENRPISTLLGPHGGTFCRSQGPKQTPQMCWTVFNLVQPMFKPYGSARGVYGQESAFLVQKRPILAIRITKTTEIWWTQGWTSFSPTPGTRLIQKFWQNQTFFKPPPPFNTLCSPLIKKRNELELRFECWYCFRVNSFILALTFIFTQPVW